MWKFLLVCWFEHWLRLEGLLVTPRFAKRAAKCFKVQRFFCLRIEREKRLQYMWTSRVRILGGQKRKIHWIVRDNVPSDFPEAARTTVEPARARFLE